jgi:hypothetical protein
MSPPSRRKPVVRPQSTQRSNRPEEAVLTNTGAPVCLLEEQAVSAAAASR